MAVREIRLFGDPVLKSVCEPIKIIDEGIEALVQDLLDTTALPGRAGVAANQIGVGLRAFSYSVEGQTGYVINPELITVDGESELVDEGCLSVPGLWHKTSRYPRATVRGLQLDNSTVEISASGVLAQAFQHECDHLDGLLYIDRLDQAERKLAMQAIRSAEWF
jgi:peptide deformylase